MSKIMKYFSMAAEMSNRNIDARCVKHGAVLVKGGRVIGYGFSSIEPHPTNMGSGTNRHAEISAIKDYLSNNGSMRARYNKFYFQRKKRGLCEI